MVASSRATNGKEMVAMGKSEGAWAETMLFASEEEYGPLGLG